MNIGFKSTLYKNIPPQTPANNEILLKVYKYITIKKNNSGYIIYSGGEQGIRKIIAYLKVYKLSDTFRKIFSRSNCEKIRNDKWIVCGVGKDKNDNYYYFIHPFAQEFQSIISVPLCWIELTNSAPQSTKEFLSRFQDSKKYSLFLNLIDKLPNPNSNLLKADYTKIMQYVKMLIDDNSNDFVSIDKVFPKSYHFINKNSISFKNIKPTDAVLFGYGNYARTITIPFLKPFIRVKKIHEIDPSLLIGVKNKVISTSPFYEKDDIKYHIWLIAGFHHTHSSLAVNAIQKGAYAIVEKPISTTLNDLTALKHTLNEHPGKLIQCFQKRFQKFNDFIFKDFNLKKGAPINYKATIFEIPLNIKHWYNWKISGSRIISNGCHWIDHFLFLNNYSKYTHFEVRKMDRNEIILLITLENGASGIITISDIGSSRIGMREYIELSTTGYRCTIIDSMYYTSESNHRIIRKSRTDKLSNLREMYNTIGRNILKSTNIEHPNSLRSSELAIEMDIQIKQNFK